MERYFSDQVAPRHSIAKSASWDLFARISPEKAALGGPFMQVLKSKSIQNGILNRFLYLAGPTHNRE